MVDKKEKEVEVWPVRGPSEARGSFLLPLIVGVVLAAWDVGYFLTRLDTMAPVNGSRLVVALLFQSLGVAAVAAWSFPPGSRIRSGQPVFAAIFFLFLGVMMAPGALHYGNCKRWGLSSGSYCQRVDTPPPPARR